MSDYDRPKPRFPRTDADRPRRDETRPSRRLENSNRPDADSPQSNDNDRPKPRFPRADADRPRRDETRPASHLEDSDKPAAESLDPHDKLAKIAGYQAVSALFHRDPQQVIRLYFDEKTKKAVGEFCSQMAKMQRPYRLVEESELQKISGTILHGGVVAAALPRAVPDFDVDQAREWARAGEPVVVLDGIGNPHNLGAIARTLAFFGMKYLLISDHPKQAGLSDAAHRVAEGGLEHLEVYRVHGLPKACRSLREHYRVVGTSLSPRSGGMGALLDDARPVALLLGNEESGLSAETLNACEDTVIIRGAGLVQSLNVSATAAILLHQMAANRLARAAKKRAEPNDRRPVPTHRQKPRPRDKGRP